MKSGMRHDAQPSELVTARERVQSQLIFGSVRTVPFIVFAIPFSSHFYSDKIRMRLKNIRKLLLSLNHETCRTYFIAIV